MHTRIDLALCHLSQADSELLLHQIHQEILCLEKIADCFNNQSEISRINQIAFLQPVPVSQEMFIILKNCMDAYQKTDGYFDITIQSKNHTPLIINDLLLNSSDQTIFFNNKNIQIDLCGYIKGYALDKIKKILQKHNCTDALINMGNSSILAIGSHPCGCGWKINNNQIHDSLDITLSNQCLTLSGNETSERKHIINPRTNEYMEKKSVVSVLTNSGAEGEIFSTALFAGWTTFGHSAFLILNNDSGRSF